VCGNARPPPGSPPRAANQAADANLQGYQIAIAEMEELKLAEDQSDRAIASAAEIIIGKVPSRHSQHEPIAIELKPNGSVRPRGAQSARAA